EDDRRNRRRRLPHRDGGGAPVHEELEHAPRAEDEARDRREVQRRDRPAHVPVDERQRGHDEQRVQAEQGADQLPRRIRDDHALREDRRDREARRRAQCEQGRAHRAGSYLPWTRSSFPLAALLYAASRISTVRAPSSPGEQFWTSLPSARSISVFGGPSQL